MIGCIKSIVPDSNVIIGAIRGDEKSAKPLRKAIRQGSEIIISEHVQYEVSKILKDGQLRMMTWLIKQNPMKLTFTRNTKSVIETGEELKNNLSFCHFPDNLILAQCKEQDSVLMTRDRKLLQSADYAGIMACKPKDFGGFVSVS
jgi:predicted nucleic acid-binding protein|tara:strand:- start:6 stop:440 length:435 start_codon:yes stop_codon:yes gene_type:complete